MSFRGSAFLFVVACIVVATSEGQVPEEAIVQEAPAYSGAELVQDNQDSDFVSVLLKALAARCGVALTKASDKSMVDGSQICSLATDLAGPLIDLLKKATKPLNSKHLQLVSVDDNSISFKAQIALASQQLDISGTVMLDKGILTLTAGQPNGIGEQKIAPATYLSNLDLEVQVNLPEKMLVTAGASAKLRVQLGKVNVNTTADFDWGDKGISMLATIATDEVEINEAFRFDATLDFNYTHASGASEGVLAISVVGDAQLKAPVRGGIDITFDLAAHYRSGEGGSVFNFHLHQHEMIEGVIPGVPFISLGFLNVDIAYGDMGFQDVVLAGTICLGEAELCEDGESNDENIVGRVTFDYNKAAGSWMIWAKLSTIDLYKLVSMISSREVADSIPGFIGRIGFHPLQNRCLDMDISSSVLVQEFNNAAKPDVFAQETVDGCYFVLGFSKTTVTLDTVPPVQLQPGWTLAATLDLFDKPTLVTVQVPSTGITIPVPGTLEPARFAVAFSKLPKNLPTNVAKIGKPGALEPFFAFGQSRGSGKLKFDVDLPVALDIAAKAIGDNVPTLKKPLSLAVKIINTPLSILEKLLAKIGLQLEVYNGLVKSPMYFGLLGATKNEKIKVMVLINSEPLAVMGMLVVDTDYFNTLITEATGVNMFKAVKILSNIVVSVRVSSSSFLLPAGVTLPKPFEHTVSVDKGFCFEAVIGPPKSCGSDPLCSMLEGLTKKAPLQLTGCYNMVSAKFGIGIQRIVLKKNLVEIRNANVFFEMEATPPSVTFGAEVSLHVKMKDWVEFYGSFYMGIQGSSVILGMTFRTVGMIPKCFGISKLQLYDLFLKGEIGVNGGVPVVNSIQVGGGICLGTYEDCQAISMHLQATPMETLIQQQVRPAANITVPVVDGVTMSPHEETNFLQHVHTEPLELVTIRTHEGKVASAVSGKAYVGFTLATGNVFIYAGITQVSIASMLGAVIGGGIGDKLPKWMSKVVLEPFDQEACEIGMKSACMAYFSFATMPATVDIVPPLEIPMGLAISARLTLFGASLGLKMNISPTEGKADFLLQTPALTFAGGAVKIWKSQTEMEAGPEMEFHMTPTSFAGSFSAYVKLGPVVQADVQISIDKVFMKIEATNAKLFGGLIQCNAKAEFLVIPGALPMPRMVEVDLDVKPLGELLQKLTKVVKKGLSATIKFIEKIFEKIKKGMKKATKKLKKAQESLEKAQQKCKKASKKVESQKKKCKKMLLAEVAETDAVYVQTDATALTMSDSLGRRRRKRGGFFKKAGKKIKKAGKKIKKAGKKIKKAGKEIKKAAVKACKNLLKGISKSMKSSCGPAIKIAKAGIKPAIKTMSLAKQAFNKGTLIAKTVMKKAEDVLDFLTDFRINSIGFTASLGPDAEFALRINMTMQKSVLDLELKLDKEALKDGAKLAKQMFSKLFAATENMSKKWFKTMKREILKINI